jgi:hypothetical protein
MTVSVSAFGRARELRNSAVTLASFRLVELRPDYLAWALHWLRRTIDPTTSSKSVRAMAYSHVFRRPTFAWTILNEYNSY